ncbi:Mut7-C RNAse domain-containing protein [Zobellella sp. An-6]|uniref:Mut7-C RNAse domain-containing protein n=1 Tax=Zobellella sp. An-6 TaxID=3400218 RepID=UPI004042A48E
MGKSRNPRFVADAMLGRLARWLRVLDFDTRYEPALDDHRLVALADAEGRVLLTRDRHLVRFLRPEKSLLIAASAPLAQLEEVILACRLGPPPRLFRRCLLCNNPLNPARAGDLAGHPPPLPPDGMAPVFQCPGCRRLYWPGSHTRRMREALCRALPGWLPED